MAPVVADDGGICGGAPRCAAPVVAIGDVSRQRSASARSEVEEQQHLEMCMQWSGSIFLKERKIYTIYMRTHTHAHTHTATHDTHTHNVARSSPPLCYPSSEPLTHAPTSRSFPLSRSLPLGYPLRSSQSASKPILHHDRPEERRVPGTPRVLRRRPARRVLGVGVGASVEQQGHHAHPGSGRRRR